MIKAKAVLWIGISLIVLGFFYGLNQILLFDISYITSNWTKGGTLIYEEEILPGKPRTMKMNVVGGAEEISVLVGAGNALRLSVSIIDPDKVVVYESEINKTQFIRLPVNKTGDYTITFSNLGYKATESLSFEREVSASYSLRLTPEKYTELYGSSEIQLAKYVAENIVVPFVPGIIVIIIGTYMRKRQRV